MWKATMACGLLALAGTAVSAWAADMPLFPPPVYTDAEPAPQLEFGTGWYLRGDISASYENELAYSNGFTGSLAAVPFVPPATPTNIVTTRQDWNYALGVGAGYKFNDYFRMDVTGDYLGRQVFNANAASADGTFTVVGKSRLERWDGLVNAYVDLGNWSGLQPYVGAGVGFAGIQTRGNATTTFGGLQTNFTASRKEQYNMAWAAMAGVGYQIAPHMLLDVGYRYLDLGRYAVPFTNDKKNLTDQQARVGIRYIID